VDKLESDPRLAGRLRFDRTTLRVEANDRLRAPNTDEAWRAFEPVVKAAVARAGGGDPVVRRVQNDPRDRLAADVGVATTA
jgi:hypothetical protein